MKLYILSKMETIMISFIRKSFRRKLLLVIFATFLLVISFIGVFSYIETSNTIQKDVERYSNQIIKQANMNMSRYYVDNEQFFLTIASSNEFKKWVSTEKDNKYELFQQINLIKSRYIDPYSKNHPEILSVKLYNTNGNESIYKSGTTKYNLILDPDYSIKQEPWLSKLGASGKYSRRVTHSTNYYNVSELKVIKTPILTLVQKFKFFDGSEGYLAVDISLVPFQDILHQIQLGKEGKSLIIDKNGMIIAHQDLNLVSHKLEKSLLEKVDGQQAGSFVTDSTNEMVIFQNVPLMNDSKIMVIVPYKEIASSIYKVKNVTIIMAIIGLIIATFLTFGISGSITKRLKNLENTMKSTETGNLSIRAEVVGTDEVSYLANAYNNLLNRIDSSIHQLTEARIMQQEAVISALQSQINSHFLYNALESINSMANLAEHNEIKKAALSLSNMLRYTSNYSQSIVTVNDELKHLKNYLYIIDILYGDNINFNIEVEDGIGEVACLKAIAQPIVENSIKHGFEATGNPLFINIKVHRLEPDYICILIEDNGIGFSREKVRELNEKLAEELPEEKYRQLTSIGLLNVHYRLRMFYPKTKAGLLIDQLSKGAAIKIILPNEIKGGINSV
jgi:two-component system sensor histidine kinase YesM